MPARTITISFVKEAKARQVHCGRLDELMPLMIKYGRHEGTNWCLSLMRHSDPDVNIAILPDRAFFSFTKKAQGGLVDNLLHHLIDCNMNAYEIPIENDGRCIFCDLETVSIPKILKEVLSDVLDMGAEELVLYFGKY